MDLSQLPRHLTPATAAVSRGREVCVCRPRPAASLLARASLALAGCLAILGVWAGGALAAQPVDDWTHVTEVVAALKASPPAPPVVYYFGDSAARESSVSDTVWAAQVVQRGGPAASIFTLAGRNQTFAHDAAFLGGLPDTPGIALIGVGLSRFTNAPSTKPPVAPVAAESGDLGLSYWVQHKYGGRHVLLRAAKRALVRQWLATRARAFRRHRAANLEDLEELVVACQARGLRPVLVETPLNTIAAGHAFGKQRHAYRAGCRALAEEHGLSYLSFQSRVRLVDADFYDLLHLVKPGYVKWQKRLSRETVDLLK